MKQIKSGFLSSEFAMVLLVMLLPLLGVELEEQLIAGFVATVYAIGRAVVKARTADIGETVITVEGLKLDYSPEDLLGLGQLLQSWWKSKPMQGDEDWAELARVIVRRIQGDIDEELRSGGRGGGAAG